MDYTHNVPTMYEGDLDAAVPGHILEIAAWYPPGTSASPQHLRVCRMRDLTANVEYVSAAASVQMTVMPNEVAIRGHVAGPVMKSSVQPDTITFWLELTHDEYAKFDANQTAQPNPLL